MFQRTIRPLIPEWFKLSEPYIRSGSALAGCCRLRVAWTVRNGRKYGGPSTADCEKPFHRTGIPAANMLRKDKDKERSSTPPR